MTVDETSLYRYNKVLKALIESSSLEYLIDKPRFQEQFNLITKSIGEEFGYEYCNIGLFERENTLVDCGIYVKRELNEIGESIIKKNEKRSFLDTITGASIKEIKNSGKDYFYGQYPSESQFAKTNNNLPSTFSNINFDSTKEFEKEILVTKRIINFLVYVIYDSNNEIIGYLHLINKIHSNKIDQKEAVGHLELCKLISVLFENINFHRDSYQDELAMNKLYMFNDIDELLSEILKYLASEYNAVTSSFLMKANNGFVNDSPIVFLRSIEYGSEEYKNEYQPKIDEKTDADFSDSLSGWIMSNNFEKLDFQGQNSIRFFDLEKDKVPIMWDFVDISKYVIGIPIMKSTFDKSPDLSRPENNIWGVICLQVIENYDDEKNKLRLQTITRHIQVNIERAIYRTRYHQVNQLNQRIKELKPGIKTIEIYEELVDIIKSVTDAEACSIFFSDDDGKNLYLKATTSKKASSFLNNQRLPIDVDEIIAKKTSLYSTSDWEKTGITGLVFTNNISAIIYDVEKNPYIHRSFFEKTGNSHKSIILAPIKGDSGRTIGVIRCINKNKKSKVQSVFTPGDLEIINLIMSLANNAILNNEYRERQYIAMTHFGHESRIPMQAVEDELKIIEYQIKKRISKEIPSDLKKTINNIGVNTKILLHNVLNSEYAFISSTKESRCNFKLVSMSDLVWRIKNTFYHNKIETYTSRAPDLYVDESQITRVLYNLVLNAIRYSSISSTIKIVYDISTSADYLHWHQFTVSNFGIGIGENELELIFDLFYRTDRAKKKYQTGTGIGLKVCRDIMKQHGGHIGVTKSDSPTEFSLFFKPNLTHQKPYN